MFCLNRGKKLINSAKFCTERGDFTTNNKAVNWILTQQFYTHCCFPDF